MVAKVDGGLDFPGGLTQFKKRFFSVNIILIAFGGGGGGGSVDFDRDRFLAFVVVAAIVLNSLNTSVFRCVRFLRQEFFLLFCKKVELILGCFFTFFLFSSTKLSTSFSSFDVV